MLKNGLCFTKVFYFRDDISDPKNQIITGCPTHSTTSPTNSTSTVFYSWFTSLMGLGEFFFKCVNHSKFNHYNHQINGTNTAVFALYCRYDLLSPHFLSAAFSNRGIPDTLINKKATNKGEAMVTQWQDSVKP